MNADCCIFEQKTLIRQFSNGEERLQKKQPIRNQDDSKVLFELRSLTVSLLLIFWYPLLYLVLLKVYCSDHTYTTIRVAVAATGREVINAVADKLGSTDELLLVHHSSAGGKRRGQRSADSCLLPAVIPTSHSLLRSRSNCPRGIGASAQRLCASPFLTEKHVLKPNDVSVFSALSINGRLFACPREQLGSLVGDVSSFFVELIF